MKVILFVIIFTLVSAYISDKIFLKRAANLKPGDRFQAFPPGHYTASNTYTVKYKEETLEGTCITTTCGRKINIKYISWIQN